MEFVMFCVLPLLSEMWYWVFLWCLFSSLFVHGAAGLLMLVMLQRHKRGRLITLVLVSVGFLASLSGSVITSRSQRSARLGSLVFSYGSSIRSLSLGDEHGEGGGQLEAEGARRARLAWQLLSNRGRLRGADREGSSRDFVFNRLGLVLWHRMLRKLKQPPWYVNTSVWNNLLDVCQC